MQTSTNFTAASGAEPFRHNTTIVALMSAELDPLPLVQGEGGLVSTTIGGQGFSVPWLEASKDGTSARVGRLEGQVVFAGRPSVLPYGLNVVIANESDRKNALAFSKVLEAIGAGATFAPGVGTAIAVGVGAIAKLVAALGARAQDERVLGSSGHLGTTSHAGKSGFFVLAGTLTSRVEGRHVNSDFAHEVSVRTVGLVDPALPPKTRRVADVVLEEASCSSTLDDANERYDRLALEVTLGSGEAAVASRISVPRVKGSGAFAFDKVGPLPLGTVELGQASPIGLSATLVDSGKLSDDERKAFLAAFQGIGAVAAEAQGGNTAPTEAIGAAVQSAIAFALETSEHTQAFIRRSTLLVAADAWPSPDTEAGRWQRDAMAQADIEQVPTTEGRWHPVDVECRGPVNTGSKLTYGEPATMKLRLRVRVRSVEKTC